MLYFSAHFGPRSFCLEESVFVMDLDLLIRRVLCLLQLLKNNEADSKILFSFDGLTFTIDQEVTVSNINAYLPQNTEKGGVTLPIEKL